MICCRPEAAGDVISSKNVKTIESYAVLNFEVASLDRSFPDIKKNHFVTATEATVDIDDSIKRKRFGASLKMRKYAHKFALWPEIEDIFDGTWSD